MRVFLALLTTEFLTFPIFLMALFAAVLAADFTFLTTLLVAFLRLAGAFLIRV